MDKHELRIGEELMGSLSMFLIIGVSTISRALCEHEQ